MCGSWDLVTRALFHEWVSASDTIAIIGISSSSIRDPQAWFCNQPW